MEWKLITDIILILSFITLGAFVIMGLYQWITRKSLKKVDPWLLWMPLPLILMVITYLIFDKLFPINTRPNGSGEPSFPSTHAMVVSTIFFIAMINLSKFVKSKKLQLVLEIIMVILIGITCTGRIFSDMHWPVDVIAGVAFAYIFTEIYYQIIHRRGKNGKRIH